MLARVSPGPLSRSPRNSVFLIGSARSGTTLFSGLLGANSYIGNWSEANHFWEPDWYPWKPENSRYSPLEYEPRSFTQRWRTRFDVFFLQS